jgi:hypothetical protein
MFYPLILVVALGVAWSIYWLFVFNQAKGMMTETREQLAAQGATLACGQERWSGYPFRIEFTCADAQIQVKRGAETISAETKDIAAVMMAYNFRHVISFIEGPSRVNGLAITHDPARLSLQAGPDESFDIAAEIPKPVIADVTEAVMARAFARRKDGKLDLAFNADEVKAHGLAIGRAEFVGTTDAAILDAPDPVSAAAKTGQAFDITTATLANNDVKVSAKGALHLDEARRPAGKITTETNDIDKLLTALAPVLQLSDQSRAAIASMLSILAKDPTSKRRSADIVAANGELYWGPFKLGDLKPLE